MILTHQNLRLRLAATIAILVSALTVNAQTKLNGSYIVTAVTYQNGEQLPDENILKHTYVKYTFNDPDQIYISGVYVEKGYQYSYKIKKDRLLIKSEAGSVMNSMKIIDHSNNKLILVSAPANGDLEDPKALKYTFYKEEFFQKNLPLSPDDVFSVKGQDTIYKSGQKIYAQFEKSSFTSYMYEWLREKHMDVKSGEILATFIVDADGSADSLKIINGINSKFDAGYAEAFKTAKNMWSPAMLNGKPVKVLMNHRLKYSNSDIAPTLLATNNANTAYQQQNYELALFFFDKALETEADNIDNLYRRGICRQMLGNIKGACADWLKIQKLGKNIADTLLQKYCQ